MDKLIFLGTGMATAYHGYTTSIVLTDGQHCFVTDGGSGNGVLLQMEKAGIALTQVTDLFISHRHTDHILGCIWLVRMIGHSYDKGLRTAPLTIYGAADVLDVFQELCKLVQSPSVLKHFGKEIILQPVASGQSLQVGPWPVTFFDTGAQKTTQYGWKALLQNGQSLVFLGDEPLQDPGRPYAQAADHLIHEAFCCASDEEKYHPHRIHHSTVVDAAQNATACGARHLILFHGEDVNLDTRKARYLAEAGRYFAGPVDAPDDLDTIVLE